MPPEFHLTSWEDGLESFTGPAENLLTLGMLPVAEFKDCMAVLIALGSTQNEVWCCCFFIVTSLDHLNAALTTGSNAAGKAVCENGEKQNKAKNVASQFFFFFVLCLTFEITSFCVVTRQFFEKLQSHLS